MLVLIGIYASSVHWWPLLFGNRVFSDGLHLSRRFSFVTLAFAVLFLAGYAAWVTFVDRSTGGSTDLRTWRRFRKRYLTIRRGGGFLVVWLAYSALMSTFVGWKRTIPEVHLYTWDATLLSWDRALHFGVDPWRLLHPILGTPWITRLIDRGYSAWYIVTIAMVIQQGWSKRRALRAQFLLAFALCWIVLGNILATVLASVGPCFYGPLTGSDYFAPLTDYLGAVHDQHFLAAVNTQEWLWETGAAGISAMPSLHVAMAALTAIVGWQYSRPAGLVSTAYAMLILVGSVHLGWHYALDGYVSLLLVPLLWYASGRFMRWYGARTNAFAPSIR